MGPRVSNGLRRRGDLDCLARVGPGRARAVPAPQRSDVLDVCHRAARHSRESQRAVSPKHADDRAAAHRHRADGARRRRQVHRYRRSARRPARGLVAGRAGLDPVRRLARRGGTSGDDRPRGRPAGRSSRRAARRLSGAGRLRISVPEPGIDRIVVRERRVFRPGESRAAGTADGARSDRDGSPGTCRLSRRHRRRDRRPRVPGSAWTSCGDCGPARPRPPGAAPAFGVHRRPSVPDSLHGAARRRRVGPRRRRPGPAAEPLAIAGRGDPSDPRADPDTAVRGPQPDDDRSATRTAAAAGARNGHALPGRRTRRLANSREHGIARALHAGNRVDRPQPSPVRARRERRPLGRRARATAITCAMDPD